MSTLTSPVTQPQVDVRGPRFAAWITTAALVVTLVVAAFSPIAAGLVLAVQAVVFALGAFLGPRRSPYGALFANVVAPRLSPVREREPVAQLRFAQLVGLIFAVVGVAGYLGGLPLIGTIATAFALIAALLNAAFGICLGCQMYPLVARLRRAPAGASPDSPTPAT
ncbi:DUF4395 domain-containing protein [Rhodococcus sp. D2-41]|uniref:DUF4395 domain-containing protein n=1 Tax=Speluncibacter jeojiensis TaxID=2710754 RepID=A0A9X4M123_9ACTN|nr:DUF4395 domain-containing protein [Rhodococcus sp. D2-41]MDG3011603.1 DUF4395 domain-containing protein [Rhodococcus sp. D2-41]MDG3015040.1 DUF4395 domain-containing protein [Corynebacteriales bacterium D3-21]